MVRRLETNKAEAMAFLSKARSIRKLEEWDLVRKFFLPWTAAELLLAKEQLKRGQITLADLTPSVRRKLIDPANLDLHAIAAGPIMDSNEIYLPAGRISLAEAKAREASLVLEARDG